MIYQKLIRRAVLRAFGMLAILLTLAVLINSLTKIVYRVNSGSLDTQYVLPLLGIEFVGFFPALMGLSFFMACVAVFTRYWSDSEMVIWFTSGLPMQRLVYEILAMSVVLGLIIILINLAVLPSTKSISARLVQQFERATIVEKLRPGKFRASDDQSIVYFLESTPPGTPSDTAKAEASKTESLKNQPKLFVQIKRPMANEVIEASIDPRLIDDVHQGIMLEQGSHIAQKQDGSFEQTIFTSLNLKLFPSDETVIEAVSNTKSTLALLDSPLPQDKGELFWRFVLPFLVMNLAWIVVPISVASVRRESKLPYLKAVLYFSVYYNCAAILQSIVGRGEMYWLQALLLLHGSAFVIALLLHFKTIYQISLVNLFWRWFNRRQLALKAQQATS